MTAQAKVIPWRGNTCPNHTDDDNDDDDDDDNFIRYLKLSGHVYDAWHLIINIKSNYSCINIQQQYNASIQL
jgi:hypothetical protein